MIRILKSVPLPMVGTFCLSLGAILQPSLGQGPALDVQPSSPWSRHFPVPRPAQPQRHEETQLDSWSGSDSRDRVPEVASSRELGGTKQVRAHLASHVSREILTPAIVASRRDVRPVETPPGWASVREEIQASLNRCDHLLRRGAVHSSRQEAIVSLRQLCRALDLHRQRWESEPTCQQALIALRESEDFERTIMTESTSVHRLVQSHQTPVLREMNLNAVAPAVAAQHYRAYARDALITAADGHPWAADLYYALGKTYEKEAMQDHARRSTLMQHATICYQAAHAVDPRRHHIANQLGFNLLQLDRVAEAAVALQASVAVQPNANAYRNLAEVYRRTGQAADMQLALHQATAMSANEVHYSQDNPEITEISPEEFARISPPNAMYHLHQTPSEVAARPSASRTIR